MTGAAKWLRNSQSSATEVKKLSVFLSFSYYFEDTVTNFEKEMFRKESLTLIQTKF